MSDLITVIIPTYNRVDFIEECINSVLTQTYSNLELLIIDDGSTDNTKNIVENIIETSRDPRIKYIYQENKGVAEARNTGIKNANGNLVAFLDSDDYWTKEKLEKQIKLIKTNDSDLVHTGFYIKDLNTITKSNLIKHNFDKRGLHFQLLKGNFICTSSILIKKECLDKVGFFDKTFSPCEDYDMWLRLSEKKYIFDYIEENLLYYREYSSDNISKNIKNLEKANILILDEHTKNNINFQDNTYLKNQTYSRVYSHISVLYYLKKDSENFINYYIKSIKLAIGNHIFTPNDKKAYLLLIYELKKINLSPSIMSYTYLRFSRQNFHDKDLINTTLNLCKCFIYSPKVFFKFFILGFIPSVINKLMVR